MIRVSQYVGMSWSGSRSNPPGHHSPITPGGRLTPGADAPFTTPSSTHISSPPSAGRWVRNQPCLKRAARYRSSRRRNRLGVRTTAASPNVAPTSYECHFRPLEDGRIEGSRRWGDSRERMKESEHSNNAEAKAEDAFRPSSSASLRLGYGRSRAPVTGHSASPHQIPAPPRLLITARQT